MLKAKNAHGLLQNINMKIHTYARYPNYRIKEIDGWHYVEQRKSWFFGIEYWTQRGLGIRNDYHAAEAALKSLASHGVIAEIIHHS